MPNWCLNKLTVEHEDVSMVDRFEKAYNLGTACNEFIPMPEGYLDNGKWYDWSVDNWGTKWDIGADVGTDREEFHGFKAMRVGNQVSCSFDSAWAPPIGLYDELVELGYNVKASYFEPGMCFCGIYDNGVDKYIEYTSKDMIPVAIWNDFDCGSFFSDEVEA
jgi:hypothetical protein